MMCAGITGHVAFDEDRNRPLPYTISMIQRGQYVPLYHYMVDMTLVPILNDAGWEQLKWPGEVQQRPVDTPGCGWDNEYCNLSKRKTFFRFTRFPTILYIHTP